MGSNPRKWGYVYAAWSSRLLCHYLRENHGMHVSRRMVRRALHQMGYRYKRPRYVLARRSPTWQQAKGGLQRGLRNRKRTVILFLDETILRETPPLRTVWGQVGEQICVPITGNRNRLADCDAMSSKMC